MFTTSGARKNKQAGSMHVNVILSRVRITILAVEKQCACAVLYCHQGAV